MFDYLTYLYYKYAFLKDAKENKKVSTISINNIIDDHEPKNKKITDTTLIGTHNSAASSAYKKTLASPFSDCQNTTITEQLKMGIRALDLRLRFINNYIGIHHGQIYYNVGFSSILNEIAQFLRANKTQFVVLVLKREHTIENTRDPQDIFAKCLEQFEDLILKATQDLTLHNMQGHMIIFTRSAELFEPKFVRAIDNWGDNMISYTDNFIIQDLYNPKNLCEKYQAILDTTFHNTNFYNVDEIHHTPPKDNRIVFNFISKQFQIGDISIKKSAERMNYLLMPLLSAKNHHCIYFIDYAEKALVTEFMRELQ